jgi:stage V sporulation protein SpoVS
MTTSNDSGVLAEGNPAVMRSFAMALMSQLTRASSVQQSSRFKMIIDDPCFIPEPTFRAVLSEISARAQQEDSESAIRDVLAEHLTVEQLNELKVFVSGKHQINGGFAVAAGTSQVEAVGQGVLFAVGRAVVVAKDSFEVYATDEVTLSAHGDVNVDASGSVKIINCFDRVTGSAIGKVQATLRGHSQFTVGDQVHVDAFDNVTINGDGRAVIRCYGASRVRGRGSVHTSLFDRAQGWFVESPTVDVFGSAFCYAEDGVNINKKSLNARVFRYPNTEQLEAFSWAYDGTTCA